MKAVELAKGNPMHLPITTPKRELYQVITDIIDALGGYKEVAAICLVAPVTVNKWKEDPTRSGQDIPIKHLQRLLAAAGERLANLPLQNFIDELIHEHLLNLCHRCAYLEEKVYAFVEMLQSKSQVKKVVNS